MSKSVMFLACMCVLGLLVFSGTVRADSVAHWTFEEGGGTMAGDSTGSHTGTLVGNASWAPGKVGNYALNLDGSGDYLSVPHNADLNITGDITIAAWVYFRRGGNGSSDSSIQSLVTKMGNTGSTNNPYDFRTGVATTPDLALVRADSLGHVVRYSDPIISLNLWHHVAVTVSNTSIVTFYVDGIITGQTGTAFNKTPTGNTHSLLIGARDGGLYLNGMIDDVWLFNNALSESEIKALVPEPATLLLLLLGVPALRKRYSMN